MHSNCGCGYEWFNVTGLFSFMLDFMFKIMSERLVVKGRVIGVSTFPIRPFFFFFLVVVKMLCNVPYVILLRRDVKKTSANAQVEEYHPHVPGSRKAFLEFEGGHAAYSSAMRDLPGPLVTYYVYAFYCAHSNCMHLLFMRRIMFMLMR